MSHHGVHSHSPLGSPLSVSAAAAASAGAAMVNGLMTSTGQHGGGRSYSPTYRVPDQMRDPMRRCMTNPPVSE